MATQNPVELAVESSADDDQPFLLRVYDVSGDHRWMAAYSETYTAKAGACHSAALIKAGEDLTYEAFKGKDDKWYWHIQAENNRILVRSSLGYPKESTAKWRMNWLKADASGAAISGCSS